MKVAELLPFERVSIHLSINMFLYSFFKVVYALSQQYKRSYKINPCIIFYLHNRNNHNICNLPKYQKMKYAYKSNC